MKILHSRPRRPDAMTDFVRFIGGQPMAGTFVAGGKLDVNPGAKMAQSGCVFAA